MPKIEIDKDIFLKYSGCPDDLEKLKNNLDVAKAELNGFDPVSNKLKIDLNDTNRPDLWSTAGLARQLRVYRQGTPEKYDFFHLPDSDADCGERRVIVDATVSSFRPYLAAFTAVGVNINDGMLRDIIQSQEKICANFGQKRRSISMGVYRYDKIKFPVRYHGIDPDQNRIIPLHGEQAITLRQTLKQNEKGCEYGAIIADQPLYPVLQDSADELLSLVPIINSNFIGAVEVGDSNIMVELTGTDLSTLSLAAAIMACDLADIGFTIEPMRVEYPQPLPFGGNTLVYPCYFQHKQSLNLDYAGRLLGEEISGEQAATALRRMDLQVRVNEREVTITPPPYRNDFLNPADVVEDLLIGYGLENFTPSMPTDFTAGRLTSIELLNRRCSDLLIGLGYQEMIFNYLGPRADFVDKMRADDSRMVEIDNPMTENYQMLRASIIPLLLAASQVSANAAYPHAIFETGKTACRDEYSSDGTRTNNYLAFLYSEASADFNTVRNHLAALFYYLSLDLKLQTSMDNRFINGRCAAIIVDEQPIGIVGEIAPPILENWRITIPCAACEINLDKIVK